MSAQDVSNIITSPSNLVVGGNHYQFKLLNKNPIKGDRKVNDYIYTFVSQKTGLKYYANCVEYDIGVFAVKFYLKIHKNDKHKYNLVINKGDGRKVLKTIIAIMLDVLKRNDSASFAFIGMPKPDESRKVTTRYCVYRGLCSNYFNPENFDHVYDEQKAFYSLLNKKVNTDKLLKQLSDLAQHEIKDEPTHPVVSLNGSTSRVI